MRRSALLFRTDPIARSHGIRQQAHLVREDRAAFPHQVNFHEIGATTQEDSSPFLKALPRGYIGLVGGTQELGNSDQSPGGVAEGVLRGHAALLYSNLTAWAVPWSRWRAVPVASLGD